MIGKLLSHILGNMEEDAIIGVNSAQNDNGEDLLEYDDGEWIIINIHGQSLSSADVDPLENLLIEHPSMSVYKMVSPRTEEEEDEELSSDEDEEGSPRPVPFKRHLSWRLAGWGSPLPCSTIQCGKTQMDRRKLSRNALQRQNLARIRFSPSDRRYGFFKQPCQRLYNY
ncbi:tumor protein p53-inducible nuclear protein 2 isoform X2 [Sardina pilchardus]|uniref:tumor protein p53-inducible nuclear protein 2 isoform X2 n=1 Tax=Sardina pilchardus TaxID=27697 RepID=UPI002E137DED